MEEFEKEYIKRTKINIISWYNFKENADIYVLGDDVEEFVQYLKFKGKNVYSNHLKELSGFYDYIIVFENVEIIGALKKYLKPDGIILLVVNNKYGTKKFAILEEFKKTVNGEGRGYSKNQIENKLEECNYTNYKFYYPLPDYDVTNVIFSDDYLPEYNNTKLLNNYYYLEKTKLLFREGTFLKDVTKSKMFPEFTNSYLVEINNRSPEKFISFNNMRREDYRLCTKMYKDYVIKESINDKNDIQINRIIKNIEILKECGVKTLDFISENKIYSKYVLGETLDQNMVDLILNNDVNSAIELIKEYYQFIQKKFKNDKTNIINEKYFGSINYSNELFIVKNCLIDFVFENIFKIDGEFYAFDQEWLIENAPLEFVLYRAINNMYIYNSKLEKHILREELYRMFGIETYISDFIIAERIFQQEVVDQRKINIYDTR